MPTPRLDIAWTCRSLTEGPRSLSGSACRLFDHFPQTFRLPRFAGRFFAVNVEGWRRVNTEGVRAFAILEDARRNNLAVEVVGETIGIDSNLFRIIDKNRNDIFRVAPGFLVLVKFVMHRPEFCFPLQAGGFGGLRGDQSELVIGYQRILAKYHPQPIAKIALHLF